MVGLALLFTAAAMRLIGGLSSALAPDRRYWIHSAFTCLMIGGIAIGFWNLWSIAGVTWTLPRFLLALGIPGANYYIATVLIPENPADVPSWRDYYYATRVRFFGGLLALLMIQAVSARVLLGMAWTDPVRILDLGFMGFALVGMRSDNPRVHAGLAILMAVVFLSFAFVLAVQPGWLAA